MSGRGARKWLPQEAYRFLALAALGARNVLSKRQLAWELRANHYMVTRVLGELREAGHVVVEDAGADGYQIRLTPAGRDFHGRHRDYATATYKAQFEAHFRFGKRPAWARF